MTSFTSRSSQLVDVAVTNFLQCSTSISYREVKEKLTEKCREEVTRTQIDASKDYKVDAMLNELCTADAEVLCKDVVNKDGQVQQCLRGKRAQLSWDCQEELFRQEVGCFPI